jgi:hypothetical protein
MEGLISTVRRCFDLFCRSWSFNSCTTLFSRACVTQPLSTSKRLGRGWHFRLALTHFFLLGKDTNDNGRIETQPIGARKGNDTVYCSYMHRLHMVPINV